jgi:uncharacterized SAM-binding protein YcdF (DUF218 family)
MPAIGLQPGKDPPPAQGGTPASRGPFVRLLRAVALSALAVVGLFTAGFVWFLWNVPGDEIAIEGKADGIAVLTGGASRIADAVELLAAGRGQRLLITGVHPTTSEREIARLTPQYAKIFRCCVDLGRSAVNTVGNAMETRRWASDRGFKSLIVVTSNYHIPRAMAELSHQLPGVRLIPYPVVTNRGGTIWSNGIIARLLFSEYVKYMVAVVRMQFEHQA